jgi:hypothetical protein
LPPVEAPAVAEPLRPPPVANASVVPNSPHHASHAVTRMTGLIEPWAPRAVTTQSAVPLGQPSLQGALVGPPPPLPLAASRAGPSPIAAPGPPPVPAHNFPPPSSSYNEWQRSSTQPPVTGVQPLSGSSSGPSSIHLNHLRDLRPPPITSMPHHQAGPISHGLGQPMINGVPPSSPRRGPPPIHNGGSSFVTPYHPSTHPPTLPHLTNGGPPPRTSEHSFSQGLLSQRSPFSTAPHRSPPVSREGISMSHEPNITSNNSHSRSTDGHARPNDGQLRPNDGQSRPNDGRPANGASASPSLRNLLI